MHIEILQLPPKQLPAYGRGKAIQDIQIPKHKVSTQAMTF